VSRITLESHYRRRSLLVLLWNEAPRIYGLLSPAHQWELHRFYQPDRMVDFDEFALHIAALKRTEPSLVNRVGKHFAKLESFYLASGTELSKLRGGGNIRSLALSAAWSQLGSFVQNRISACSRERYWLLLKLSGER
jgi:hypothetical protein